MAVHFFDTLNKWHELVPFVQHTEFVRAVNQRRWWQIKEQVGTTTPLLYDILEKEVVSRDRQYVENKLNSCTAQDPWWYCVPHDCVDLNPLVTGRLISLYLNKPLDQLYYISLLPNDAPSWEYHVVITDTPLTEGKQYNVTPNSGVALYDLIYPLLPYQGDSWHKQEPLVTATINHCLPLDELFRRMSYNQGDYA